MHLDGDTNVHTRKVPLQREYSRHPVLPTPREVVKKRGQEYTLLWRESPDFVRLAAKCNALIVPFAAVGADDAYDVGAGVGKKLIHPTSSLYASAAHLAPQSN